MSILHYMFEPKIMGFVLYLDTGEKVTLTKRDWKQAGLPYEYRDSNIRQVAEFVLKRETARKER